MPTLFEWQRHIPGTCFVQVYHELVVLEKLHERPEFCPGASLEAITKPPLLWH